MTAILGVVSLAGGAIGPEIEQQFDRIVGNDQERTRIIRADGAIVALPHRSWAPVRAHAPAVTEGRFLFAADAQLDNRVELGSMLSITAPELTRTSDSALIQDIYGRWGEQGIARCLGPFVFAAWDAGERRLTFGRDCLGERAMFFHHGKGSVAFASDLRALLGLPFVPRTLDELMVANFLALNLSNPRRTFYRDIERVPSRTLVTIDRNGVNRRQYWSPDFDAPPPYKREDDYVERARELLDQAVATATADTPRVAISLSGGLDSSAIAATAARLGRADSISCFCIVPPEGMQLEIRPNQYLDERDKVTALARMYPVLDTEFYMEGAPHSFESDPTRFFARTGYPIRNPSNSGSFYAIAERMAASGHRVMLVGSRGNLGLSWSGRFSSLGLLREGKLVALIRDIVANSKESKNSLLRTAVGDLFWCGAPSALLRRLHRLRGRDPDSVARYSVLNPALVSELDLTRLWREESFDPWFKHGGWDPARLRARFMFDHNQLARDYRAMSSAIHGVETRDPHQDRRLLEFLLTVPEPMYRRNGIPRSFARKVLADRLPPDIVNERRDGYQSATWFHRLSVRREDIAAEIERFETSPLANRMLDLPRLKRIHKDWPKDDNAAEARQRELRSAFSRGIYTGQFIRWVEGGNA